MEKGTSEPDQAAATALQDQMQFIFSFPSLSHLAQKSIEGFIAEPAFRPNDNIMPVTLARKYRLLRLCWLGMFFDN